MILQSTRIIRGVLFTMFGGPSRHLRQMRYTVSPYERNQWTGRHDYDTARPRSQAINFSSARAQHLHSAPSSLSEDIMSYYEKNKQSAATYQKKMELRDSLFAIMKDVFPYCGLYVTGSSMNGFGTESSDIDLTLMVTNHEMGRRETLTCIRSLHQALRHCSFLENVMAINAVCPILRFTDIHGGFECDLSVNNSIGIRNTHLLNAYSQLDSRVAPLVMFVKRWAKFHNINDAYKRSISSYSLVLMIINYLQVCNPPVLPCLQSEYPQDFSNKNDIRLLTLNDPKGKYRFTSKNTVDVGQLFMGFLNYYANVFDFERSSISIRLGKTIPRADAVQPSLRMLDSTRPWKHICIEEPFNLSNTARAVREHVTFMHILYVFKKSYKLLQEERDIRSILSRPIGETMDNRHF